ncbi:MAG: metallophosphoesterase [Polyangiaceae bacterium]|nr:metallophosphoesterase [Polyangiaceae bacterium]
MSQLENLLRPVPALFARYYPELAAGHLPGFVPFDFRTFARSYCAEIVRDKQYVHLLGFPPDALREKDAKAHIRLADLFVPTVFRKQQNREERTGLADLLNAERSVLVLGDPGMGKTMLLTFLALLHADGVATLAEYTPPPKRIPLFVSLREYALEDQAHNVSLLEYLAKRCSRFSELRHAHPAFFEASLRMGEAIVLLDGLDEVGSSAARKRMADRVRELRREYPDCPVWVTSRIHGYTHDIALPQDEFHHVLIGALDDAQVDDFLTRWYQIQLPDDPQKQAENKNSLRQAIFRTKQVRALASNPLLLTLMAFVHRFLGHLPQDRGELYEQCVNMLFRSWLDARERPEKHAYEHLGLATELPRGYLEALAFHVQEHGLLADDEASGARGLFSKDDALAFLTTHHLETDRRDPSISPLKAREEMREFVDYACDRVGLLVDRGGGKLSFLHLSFQEYLAASFDTVMTTIRDQEAVFVKHFRDPTWSEVFLLRLYLFARKRDRAGLNMFDDLVRALLDELERCDDITGWLLLGRALRDRHDIRQSQRRVILERLVRAWATSPVFEGDVYVVLEDIRVFATDVVQAELRAACAQVQSSGLPAEAVAALHLEEKLFGGVAGSAKRFFARADLPALLPDLVVFWDVPEIATLLAEKSTPEHWEAAFGALNGEDVHRCTLGWAIGATQCPVKSDATIVAAIRWVRRKINAEVESREAFAAQYPNAEFAPTFAQPGTLVLDGKSHQIETPLAFATRSLPPTTPLPHCDDARLAQGNLAIERFFSVQSRTPFAGPLTTFLTRFISDKLRQSHSHNATPGELPARVANTFVQEFVRDFGRYFDCTFVRDFVQNFGREYGQGLAGDFEGHFRARFARSFIRIFVRSFVEPVVRKAFEPNLMTADTPQSAFEDIPNLGTRLKMPTNRFRSELSAPRALPVLLADIGSIASIEWFLTLGRHLHAYFPDGVFPDNAWKMWLAANPMWAFWSALAWNEHAKLFQQNHGKLDGPLGALMLAHADYASLMTGLDLENAEDYPIWKSLVEAAGPEQIEKLRRFVSASAPAQPPSPAPVPIPKPAPAPEPAPLFTYLHLSDMHFGLPKAGDRHHQSTVLAALRDEFLTWSSKSLPRPDAIFITGDIAWAGKISDYDAASKWLDEILKILGLTSDRVFVVPGNHDADRSLTSDRMSKLLLAALREGTENLDEVLEDENSLDVLLRRKDAYLQFAKRFAPACHHPDIAPLQRLAWTHREQARGNLAVHIVGFDTALLAAGNDDAKKLRLGQAQNALLNDCAPEREFVVVLGHHPFNGEWLHPDEERDAAMLVRRRAHVYLAGHVHDHDSAQVISGGGTELLRVVAGAIYGGRQKDIPQGHSYSVGAVMPPFEGKPVRLRIHPRRFSFKQGDFRTDTDNVPDGKPYADFDLHRLKL